MWIIGAVLLALAQPKLSWESNIYVPWSRVEWSTIILNSIEEHYNDLDKVQDMGQFCPNYNKLDKIQRTTVWGELFVSLTYWESGWNPHSDYTETTLGIDKVTGQPVISSGLMQLSYGDVLWAKWCRFDWQADKDIKTYKTSIHNPKNNLQCGVGIMARQIRKYGKITLDKNVYWSTLRIGSQRSKIKEISKRLQYLMPYCGGNKDK